MSVSFYAYLSLSSDDITCFRLLVACNRYCVQLSIIIKFSVSQYSFGNFTLSLLQILFSVLYRRLYILLCVLVASAVLCEAQTIALPDSLFSITQGYDEIEEDDLPQLDGMRFSFDQPLFVVPPATTVEDYLTAPDYSNILFEYLPELPSEFFLHVLLLHLSKVKTPELEAEMAVYRTMMKNFNHNLYKGGGYSVPYVPAIVSDVTSVGSSVLSGGAGVVMSGCLDPIEAYRRWVQERRLLRARKIIRYLEDETLPSKEELMQKEFKVSNNFLQMKDDSYDVKVKSDGNNPPYRP